MPGATPGKGGPGGTSGLCIMPGLTDLMLMAITATSGRIIDTRMQSTIPTWMPSTSWDVDKIEGLKHW